MSLTEDMNRALARNRVQGQFVPCPLDAPCGNCGCQLRRHWDTNRFWYATKCRDCPCEIWQCRHGGQRVAVPQIPLNLVTPAPPGRAGAGAGTRRRVTGKSPGTRL